MYKRRDIREAAVQFLYFFDIENGADPSEAQDAFWQIVQEDSLKKLSEAKAKAIFHLVQGRKSRMEKLSELVPLALAEMKAAGNLTALTVPLRAVLRQESKLSASIELLRSAMLSKSESNQLDARLNDVFIVNRVATDARTQWTNTLEDFPAWENKLAGITKALNSLQDISERLEALESLDASSTPVRGLEHLHASSSKIKEFRKETHALISEILKHKEEIDKKLVEVVENFSPERVVPVDRAILRMGVYEILYCDDIPRAVSINEAIEIAKRFGTNESGRFVNGILDAIKAPE